MSDTAGPSRPTPPIFQPASSSMTASMGSLRNASNGEPSTSASSEAASAAESASVGAENGAVGENTAETPAQPPGPVKPVVRSAASKKAIVYSAVQRRNPVLHAIKNVPTEIGDIVADYQVGTHNGVLFLSLKYHRLHPEYIHQRIEKMKNMYQLRILLVLCDVAEHQVSLRELAKIAIINDFTTFVAWSNDEVAQYLATFKQYEHKSADTLKERVHQTYHDQLQHVLTSGKKVNKGDAANLASQFGSFATISRQSAKTLATVKGLGPSKVTSLSDAFTKPFLVGGLKRARSQSETEVVVPAVEEAAVSRAGGTVNGRSGGGDKAKVKAKGGAGDGGEESNAEEIGSPDWPSDNPDDDDKDDAPAQLSRRGRGVVASRSPGLSPEPREGVGVGMGMDTGTGTGDAWRDPLEEDEEEEQEEQSSKRPRLS